MLVEGVSGRARVGLSESFCRMGVWFPARNGEVNFLIL